MATTISDPLVGTLVDGRYEVVSRIARGGMATVYLAVDRRLDRNVALKVMHAHLAEGVEGAEFVSRFRREARAAARLTHPGLVAVHDQGFDGEVSYLTMEFVPGTNLRRRLRTEQTLTLGDTLALLEEVLEALAAAHRVGLVHRDVKPENVLLTEEGRVKLTDFGLARAVTEVTATATGTVLGTVAYLSPEVITSGQGDTRADVYAVGVLAYEMLLGRHPHRGSTPIQVAYQHVNADAEPPSRSVWWMPVEVDELVCALLARDPDDRPRDATAALHLVRQTRAALSPADLERRVDPPAVETGAGAADGAVAGATGTTPEVPPAETDDAATTVFAAGVVAGAARATDAALDTPPGADGAPLDAIPTAAFSTVPATTRAYDVHRDLGVPPAPTPPRRRRHPVRWTLLVVLVLALAVGGWTWWQGYGPGAYTAVPTNIVGVSQADAEAALTAVGLESAVTTAFDDDVPRGDVVSVDPGEGEKAHKDGPVDLTVSRGIEKITVPDGVVGSGEDKAVSALERAGFDVPTPTSAYSDTVPKGTVVSVTPKEGSTVPHTTHAKVVVSQGPAPVDVPQVTGSTEDVATQTLADFGLKVSATEKNDDTIPAGTVMSQSPTDGTAAHRGDTVEIVVSKGPEMVDVPDVTGESTKDARKKLQDAGFKVKVSKFAGGFFDRVRFQSPGGKSQAPKGSTVTLTVF
ncbi:Stk1 family PASTA domain-containing Ser/Thr kinase [Luteimicrobium subarcticum]|uniref:Stk1 family PASTA domain-containing Ser/Thr kinase n=1 Tax=Luteimicrobium subarcticum TaxID=620910 RepID=UPI000C243D32|nr:Stk1 family PASTA domain-containing Ser/Thr kinase [Luteimicrobium subarcticum]